LDVVVVALDAAVVVAWVVVLVVVVPYCDWEEERIHTNHCFPMYHWMMRKVLEVVVVVVDESDEYDDTHKYTMCTSLFIHNHVYLFF